MVDVIIIQEHKSSSYSPRTYANAASADVTIAIAVDHNTTGEKCTQKAVNIAKSWILKITPDVPSIMSARAMYHFIKHHNARIINVAGNGIYTWSKKEWSQEQVNLYVYEMFKLVHPFLSIDKIVCGGQTGVDLAGAVAAYKLGIPCVVTMPKGFKMRFEDGKDVDTSEEFVRKLIVDYSEKL